MIKLKAKFAVIFILILSCSKNREEIRIKFKDGIKTVIELDRDSMIGYRKFYDSTSSAYLGFEKYHRDTLIYELRLSKLGDTILYDNGLTIKDYKKNMPVSWFFTLESKNGKSLLHGLAFDTIGNLVYNVGDLSLFNKSDSAELNRFYPDWQSQVKAWEERKTIY